MNLKLVLPHSKCLPATLFIAFPQSGHSWSLLSKLFCFISPVVSVFLGAKNLTLDLSHPRDVPWQTGCHGDWVGRFHWKFQVDTVKFFLRKLACVLPLKWAGFDKYTLSNKVENSILLLYLQRSSLIAVCLSRQCSSAQQENEGKKNQTQPQYTKWKWNADTAFTTCRAKCVVVNQQDKVTSRASVWTSCSLRVNKITVLVCSHLYLSAVHMQLFGNHILRSFCAGRQ